MERHRSDAGRPPDIRRIVAAVILLAALGVAWTLGPVAGAATAAKDPKTAKQLAALLAAKKLGCRNFAAESPPGTGSTGSTSSTVPAAIQALFALVGQASAGACTVGANQTVLVAFKDSKARKGFEATLAALPCPIVLATLGRFTPSTTAGATPSATEVKLPVVEVGTRGIVFSTGTEPDTDRIDLAAASSADRTIAKKTNGKVRTFSYRCSP